MTAPWKPYQQEGGNPFPRYFDAEMRYLREAGLGRYASWQCSMQLARAIDGQETVYPRTNFTGALFR